MRSLFLHLIAIVVVLTSCNNNENNDECKSFIASGVEAVSLIPTTDMIGATFQVDFYISNGCGKFEKFEEKIEGNTRTIKVIGKYEGCICTQELSLKSANYVFTTSTSGTYTLKFLKSDGTFFTETVVIP